MTSKENTPQAGQPRVPTDPELLKRMQDKWRATGRGSDPGRWSSMKAALSRREYEERGGGWQRMER